MKVNLLLDNPKGVRSGWFNIDPFAMTDDQHGRTKCSLFPRAADDLGEWEDPGLSKFIEANEAEEILAAHVLNFFPYRVLSSVLGHWVSKLRHKGKLTLVFTEARLVAKAFLEGLIGLDEVNQLLMGPQSKSWDLGKSLLSSEQVGKVLNELGLRIVHCAIDGFTCTMTTQRD